MREVVPCAGCALAASYLPAGFESRPALVCTQRDDAEVAPDDGCTLGEPGAPQPASAAPDVTIAGAESAGVWREW